MAGGPGARALRCPRGHNFDLSKQGYVQLTAAPLAHPGDTPAMVAARSAFLGAGHFAPVTAGLRDAAVAAWPGGPVLDIGAGTGHHLAAVLDALPGADGLAFDASRAAARVAARAHERIFAVVGDAWRPLPVADASAGLILDVFAPRNAAEFARVLRPDGALLVVTPAAEHLTELVEALDLLRVDAAKAERLSGTLDADFERASLTPYTWSMRLDHDEVGTLVGMGPSAWHAGADARAARIATLPAPVTVTGAVTLSVYRPKISGQVNCS